MKRCFKALCLLSLAFLASCKKDDDTSIAPPRDYAEQYVTEKVEIEEYLHTHYIVSVDENFTIEIDSITADNPQTSIWDQTEYPLQTKLVTLNDVDYTLYYLILNEGGNEVPTPYDRVKVAYRGWRMDDYQFDYNPYPDQFLFLPVMIEGWREIIPLFKTGFYNDTPGDPNPASFTNFGAGVMFLPSDFGYYDSSQVGIPSYSPLVFSFKLYDMQQDDSDNDGIPTYLEVGPDSIDVYDYDSDGDGTPNFQDADDDGDGISTRIEITIPGTEDELYDFENIPVCEDSGESIYLDPTCFPEQ
ncbi:FKBP-type peptidyl-prolyl cis-trans isomerase [Flavobacterium beibuense]|uniref:Putative lipoprotein n=1 Tax=Flavobacterium beibuense TaxID=657326 RepID=A0A444W4B6_9FLAO|nr:FKBP-type peptidylprolyl isomerase [Flavobacterium beibuense]RYJ40538.1 putative lipoprotein [Flavobacterium beibuense]